MRALQLFLGPIFAICGIGFLLYQAVTDCNAAEIYVFFISGITLVTVDIHEFVRRWPLRAPLLVHHLMTFVLALAFIEFEILPPNEDKTISWTTTLFLTNIGIMWTVDFYHVVYRTSGNLSLIKKYRKVYMFLAPVRIVNIILLLLGSISSALEGVWFGFAALTFMTLAYAYNSYHAIMFVVNFNCESYYNAHQSKWLDEEEDQKTQTLSKMQRRSLSQLVQNQGRRLSVLLSISLIDQDQPVKLLPGLGGDKGIEEFSEEYDYPIPKKNSDILKGDEEENSDISVASVDGFMSNPCSSFKPLHRLSSSPMVKAPPFG